VRVVVVGTITGPKGSGLLEECARDAAQNGRPIRFVVLGRTDRDAALRRTGRVRVTGPYREFEILDRLRAAECHLAFLPSIVPETYMYALSVVLRVGLFPVCLDLGAQAERLRSLGTGLVLSLDASPAAINQALIEAASAQAGRPLWPFPEAAASDSDLLGSYYGFTKEERARLGLPLRGTAAAVPCSHISGRDAHARLHQRHG